MNTGLEELFPAGDGPSQRVALVKKHGRVRLAIPIESRAARASLELYPAQRAAARFMRAGLCALAGLGLPLPRGTISLPPGDEFVRFLRSVAAEGGFELAVLAGNPNAEGRRWICLVFSGGIPVAVVKAGTTPAARVLIAHELSFLAAHHPAHALPPCAQHDSERVAAFALTFISAHRDQHFSMADAVAIATDWMNGDARSPVSDRPAFAALAAHIRNEREARLHAAAGALVAAETLMHGDFAPWNLKRERASRLLHVLDWERGAARGIPGWDIFHFLVQPLVLVQRASAAEIMDRVRAWWSQSAWKEYAARAGVAGAEPELFWAYLLHCTRAQPQTEGSQTLARLLQIHTDQCKGG